MLGRAACPVVLVGMLIGFAASLLVGRLLSGLLYGVGSSDPASVAAHTLIAAVTERYPISDLSIVEPELEDVIRQIYEERQVVL